MASKAHILKQAVELSNAKVRRVYVSSDWRISVTPVHGLKVIAHACGDEIIPVERKLAR